MIVFLLLGLWLALVIVGVVVEALLWLALVGLALMVLTAISGAIYHTRKYPPRGYELNARPIRRRRRGPH